MLFLIVRAGPRFPVWPGFFHGRRCEFRAYTRRVRLRPMRPVYGPNYEPPGPFGRLAPPSTTPLPVPCPCPAGVEKESIFAGLAPSLVSPTVPSLAGLGSARLRPPGPDAELLGSAEHIPPSPPTPATHVGNCCQYSAVNIKKRFCLPLPRAAVAAGKFWHADGRTSARPSGSPPCVPR